jgi:hypothetical protein
VERGPDGDKRRERPVPQCPYEAQTRWHLGSMFGAGRVLRGGARGGCSVPGLEPARPGAVRAGDGAA